MNFDQLQEMFNCSLSDILSALDATGNDAFKSSKTIPDDVVTDLDNYFKKPSKKALSGQETKPQSPIQEKKSSEFDVNSNPDSPIGDPLVKTMYDVAYQEAYTQELLLQQVRQQGVLDARQQANQQRLIAELNRSRKTTQELSKALIDLIDNSTDVQSATLEVMGKEVISYQETMKQLTPTLTY